MDEFTFKSGGFKLTILLIISTILAWDFFTLSKVVQGEYYLINETPFSYLLLGAGMLLKIGILVSVLSLRGPLRKLLYVFGGIIVIGNLAHFLAIWTGGGNPASPESLFKLAMLCVGFVLVLPAGHAIHHTDDP